MRDKTAETFLSPYHTLVEQVRNSLKAQPITLMLYLVFSILGGIWFPFTGLMGNISKGTPTFEAITIATDVIANKSVPAYLAIGLVAWLGIFAALATLSVRSMAETV